MKGGIVTLGYSIYDTVRLAENSASDIYLEKLDLAGVSEPDVDIIAYDIFEKDLKISGDDLIKHMKERTEPGPDPEQEGTDNKNVGDIPVFSASLLQMLIQCPLSYIYRKVYRVPRPEFSRRIPYRWLEPNQRGNILHHTFEKYADEVFIKNCRGYDEALLKKIFDEEIEEMKHLQPVPSEAVFEDEKEECFEAARVYTGRMHGLLDAAPNGRKVIGCEVGFDGLVHEGKNYRISFTGSIDRLDGTVKDGVLNLAIVDYKTGKPDTLNDKIKACQQIQHYIYALAAFRVCREKKEELEKRFAERIDSISISSMIYEFPFETAGEDIIDVSKEFAGKNESGIKLPDSVETILEEIEGNIQQGRLEEAKRQALLAPAKGCEYCPYTDICRAKIRTEGDM